MLLGACHISSALNITRTPNPTLTKAAGLPDLRCDVLSSLGHRLRDQKPKESRVVPTVPLQCRLDRNRIRPEQQKSIASLV